MEYVGELITLGIDSIIFGICLKQYLYCKDAIAAVKKADFYEIGSSLEEAVSNSNNKIEYVAIRGTVKSLGKPLHSINRKEITGVLQKLSIKEHVVARTTAGFWSNQEHTMQKIYNTIPFVLQNGRYKVEVLDPLSADILDMDVIADYFEPNVPSFSDHLWGFFTGVRQRGLQNTEEMLREGVVMTGIGEISSINKQNLLSLQPPADGSPFYLTTMSITSLIKKLDERKKTYKWLCFIFGAIILLISGVVARRFWKTRQERRLAEQLRENLAASRRQRRQFVRDSDLREDQLCVVCRTNPREIILLPCGHVCLCEDCADGIINQCPICREKIVQKAAAYII
ncbi:mitochondrial E3 ubiquitin protein ligase 1-like [Vespa mandarinia]|uniref:mitochondrial E3 ubiquitin protein ligase 1-like n=1 Tax=Vespa mandarinia TaxID=7446 RepID=UPI0016164B6E|nr:mitochondrial E3 ubiquitin protein ligase 1-like [Vespa mandarinia]XP_035725697.1 mitochondrial E3 ubiquitin protein ligase 1-like [Vespa mandarinia]XP_035725698.1 mitochondrial E3 ubiquitin protein ligase 1-like [Vespa mandarinia]XP_035725699.1 mitochondrial E3 ubiquitin protein ligase 1-like [Vespa mandarinia]XP_047347535.1 mitochondrial E3 ubiquitin protein ligase 1-like [Vespa velutina]XP_047347536.1 mitochondrial E3 ubiquitin protein ligase 1-like [Vespa velutina]